MRLDPDAIKKMSSGAIKNIAGEVWDGMAKGTTKTVANTVGDSLVGGYRDAFKMVKKLDLPKGEYPSGEQIGKIAKKAFSNADGSTNYNRVAGAAFTAGVAGRVVSGGGLYKDRYGNRNLPGIPFI